MYNIIYFIFILNKLHLVSLGSLHFQSDRMSNTGQERFTGREEVYVHKMKPTCGPISFPDYSCERSNSWKTMMFEQAGRTNWRQEEITLKPKEDLGGEPTPWDPIETLYDIMLDNNKETLRTKSMVRSPKTRWNLATLASFQRPFQKWKAISGSEEYEINHESVLPRPQLDLTTTLPNTRFQSYKNTSTQHLSHSRNVLKKNIQRGVSPISKSTESSPSPSIQVKSTTLRVMASQNVLFRAHPAPIARAEGIHRQRLMMHTKSTYPPFPGGMTPQTEGHPTETIMCGVAKCLAMAWTDLDENTKATENVKPASEEKEEEVLSDLFLFG